MGRLTNESQKLRSRQPDYVDWVRSSAPRNITLDNVLITGIVGAPRDVLFIGKGVTGFSLLNSEINGASDRAPFYLEAESAYNVIKGNHIHVKTGRREQLAVDGSSHNMILNNFFEELDDGGIYLYRNCGEAGVIRHSTPSHNTIVNNVFFYRHYQGFDPAIWVGSRNGSPGYCDDDKGENFGSSISDLDYAAYNVIAQNQIYTRDWQEMIKVGRPDSTDSPNYIDHNETVGAEIERRAGCYLPGASAWVNGSFIAHGERDRSGTVVCQDGELGAETAATLVAPML
jgi:hypothetical protein